jgi:hypothetical protein
MVGPLAAAMSKPRWPGSRSAQVICRSLVIRSVRLGEIKAAIDVSGAMDLAQANLAASLPRRWRHVRPVAPGLGRSRSSCHCLMILWLRLGSTTWVRPRTG